MDTSGLQRAKQLLIQFLDLATIAFVMVNVLDAITTLIGIYLHKVVETNPLMFAILESYGFSGFIFVKVSVSVLFLMPMLLRRFWRDYFWTQISSTGLGVASTWLFVYYLIVVINTINYILY